MALPLLAVSDWGIAIALAVMFLLFLIVAFVIIQGTRAQLYWRRLAEQGDVPAIQALVTDEVTRWKTARIPRGVPPGIWHGVQGAELLEVHPDGVRLSASAEGQYALVSGERREVSNSVREGMTLTARLIEMLLYDIPNVKLPTARVDIYSTYRDEQGSSQQCIMSTTGTRDLADGLDWDDMEAEDIVRAFGGRFLLDDRGNALPINPETMTAGSVPAAFYKDD